MVINIVLKRYTLTCPGLNVWVPSTSSNPFFRKSFIQSFEVERPQFWCVNDKRKQQLVQKSTSLPLANISEKPTVRTSDNYDPEKLLARVCVSLCAQKHSNENFVALSTYLLLTQDYHCRLSMFILIFLVDISTFPGL